MSRGVVARINLSALLHNFFNICQKAHGRKVLAMVKSDGYGHGLLRIARTLEHHADAFGVASLEEAQHLRDERIDTPIVVMSGFRDGLELCEFDRLNLSAVIHRFDQVETLEHNTLKRPLSVWLKVDTGMHRLGFSINEVPSVYQRLLDCENAKKPIGFMTHLADADNSDRSFTHFQIEQFGRVTSTLDGPKSIVNSAGILAYPESLADWVRPGISLYGASPFADRIGLDEGLRPVMTLMAKIISIKSCRRGDKVGYNCTWTCPEDMPIGIVGIGYGDGYPRHAKNGTPVLLNNTLCSIVGRVSMDMLAIDLRHTSKAALGDSVILWGEGLPVEEIARCADTISYELFCRVEERVQFLEVRDESH